MQAFLADVEQLGANTYNILHIREEDTLDDMNGVLWSSKHSGGKYLKPHIQNLKRKREMEKTTGITNKRRNTPHET